MKIRNIYLVFTGVCIISSWISCRSDKKNTEAENAPVSDTTQNAATDTVPGFFTTTTDTSDIILFFNPEIGKTYQVYNANITTITNSADTLQQGKLSSENYVNFALTVKSRSASGNFLVEMIQKNAKQVTVMGADRVEYISGKALPNAEDDKIRQQLDCLINAPLLLTMNKNAEIEDVSGIENIKKRIQKIIGDSIPLDQIEVPDPSDAIENLFLSFPAEPVNAGSEWEKTLPSNLQGLPILIKNKYTITERVNGMATIKFTSSISLDKSQIPKEYAQQMEALSISGSVNGTLLIEEKTGWTIEANATQNIKITEEYMGQKATTNMKGSITLKTS